DNLPDWVNGKIVDISGGGVRFKTAIPVPASQRVHLELELSLIDKKIDFVPGKVIRQDKDEVTGKYFLGIEFTGITIEDRNDIIQYVYRQQIEMDKKDKWVRE
ncbi:MAG: PilZ domain-containing protein, partial [bacterium]